MGESQADGESGTKRSAPCSTRSPACAPWPTSRPRACAPRASCSSGCSRSEPDGPGRARGVAGGRLHGAASTRGRICCGAPSPGWRSRAEPGAVTVAVDRAASARRCASRCDASTATARRPRSGCTTARRRRRPARPALRAAAATPTAAVLDGADVRFEPREVEPLPPRSSRAVAVSLAATARLRPASTAARSRPTGRPGSGCRSRSRSSRADRRRHPARRGVLRRRQPARPPRDARRHPRRRAAPLALPGRARVPEPAREGDPARAVRGDEPRVRRRATATSCRSPWRSSCCTTPSSSTTTSSTAASGAAGGRRCRPSTASGSRSTPATRWPCSSNQVLRRHAGCMDERPRRPRPVRVRRDGAAHARGPGHRAGLAPRPRRRRSSPRTTST